MLACLCAAAVAADLPSHTAPPPAADTPLSNWTGLYVGFNYGYAWHGSSALTAAGVPLFDTTALPIWSGAAAAGATGRTRGLLNGFFGGGQVGYNWQFANRVVLGLEADLQGGGIHGRGGFGSVTPAALPGFSALTSATLYRSLDYFGTVRGRLGYAVTPTILGYVTGGLAYGGTSLTAHVNQPLNPSALLTGNARADTSADRLGWTIGAGTEMAIAPNLSAKLEYLYYDLGKTKSAFPSFALLSQTDPITGASVATAMTARTRFDGHILRAGLNYRFGGESSEGSAIPTLAPVGAEPPRFGDWSGSFMPYVWALGLNGTSTSLGRTSAVNASFIDALTKASGMPLEVAANAEIRNGPVSFYTDFVWAQLRFAGSASQVRNPIAGANVAVDLDARLKMTLAILEAGGTLELARWGYAGMPAAFTAIDAVAGLRYWSLGLDLSLDARGAVDLAGLDLRRSASRGLAASGTMNWVDPFVGLRIRQQIDETNAFYVKGDVGGFSAGSRFSWQAAGGYTHDFDCGGHRWTTMVGYRALYVDYSQGSGSRRSGLDSVLHGPVASLGFKF